VSVRVWYARPNTIVANELRRDAPSIWATNDNIGIVLDTLNDRRSGYYVNTNALGAIRDVQLADEDRNVNFQFDMVWDVKSRRFRDGWTTETAIPFKSLHYQAGRQQVWGLNIQRVDRGKNEFSHLAAIPASYGPAGVFRVSVAASLVGIEAPPTAGRLELKPYAVSGLTTDRLAVPAVSNALDATVGLDARYKITRTLNADVTVNTDFAQVEVDNQQVNLTRFSLLFPEKREFFLEGASNFSFGGAGAPIVFFSRRIGLTPEGLPAPVTAGGRVLGRAGPYTVGLLTIQADTSSLSHVPATTFSVARVRRNVLNRSAIGLIGTHRSSSVGGTGSNSVVGADANLGLFHNVTANAYYAVSRGGTPSGEETSYRGQLRYAGDRFGAEADRMTVGAGFNPEIGFLFRPAGYVREFGFGRFSPRPGGIAAIRRLSFEGSIENFSSVTGALQSRVATGTFRIFQSSGDDVVLSRTQTEDRPQSEFRVAGTNIAPGTYLFGETTARYVLGPRRPVTGSAYVRQGRFYDGHKTELGYDGRVSITPRLIVEPILIVNWFSMPTRSFTTTLASARVSLAVTPRMSLTVLAQENTTTSRFGVNGRFRWEYRPGSDLFVVYSDGRDSSISGVPALLNRNILVKVTRLLRS
jgi:hypothetical protein